MDTLRQKIHEADEAVNAAIDALRSVWPFAETPIKLKLSALLFDLDQASSKFGDLWDEVKKGD